MSNPAPGTLVHCEMFSLLYFREHLVGNLVVNANLIVRRARAGPCNSMHGAVDANVPKQVLESSIKALPKAQQQHR